MCEYMKEARGVAVAYVGIWVCGRQGGWRWHMCEYVKEARGLAVALGGWEGVGMWVI